MNGREGRYGHDSDIKFSVIMPAYNAEKYIAYAIDSVLTQTYSNFELIIVNDGSTDKTEDIVKQYSDKDTRIILVSQENSGCAGAARNTALKYVTGDYIQILDADDYFEKNMFAEYAAKLKEREYDIILPDCIFVDEGGVFNVITPIAVPCFMMLSFMFLGKHLIKFSVGDCVVRIKKTLHTIFNLATCIYLSL